MLILRVTSVDGVPPRAGIEATFDRDGGTLGRGKDNVLVLPDEQQHISRLQARVSWERDAFQLTVLGTNPIECNDAVVAKGESIPLRAGDLLRIATYVLKVVDGPASDTAATDGVRRPRPSGVRPPVPPPAPAPAPSDPMAGLLEPSRPSDDDPLGLGFATGAPDVGARVPANAFAIPADFDPFEDPLGEPIPPPGPAFDARPFDLGGIGGPMQRLDDAFDLTPASVDPLAGSPLDLSDADVAVRDGRSLDPLAPWHGKSAPVAPPAADQVPEIQSSFRPPRVAPSLPAHTTTDEKNVFLSWDDDDDEVISPLPGPTAGAAKTSDDPLLGLFGNDASALTGTDPLGLDDAGMRSAVRRTAPVMAAAPGPAPVAPKPVEPTLPRTAPMAGDTDALTAALLRGLKTTALPFNEMTPELMERIGELLREATQGTLDLLVARAMTKREVRADVTMIVAKGNNPLKFSPNADVALAHLMAPQRAGFLGPVAAMRDAFDDLRAHQFGFMAGLRAALAGVLKRFDPAVLERRPRKASAFERMMPKGRSVKLWEMYTELYGEIAEEAEDDFHTLFGREFVRAYEEQVALIARPDDASSVPAPRS